MGHVLAQRLIDQADDVRVVEPEHAQARAWRSLGARVALGSPLDPDLIERAAQNVRTTIVLDEAARVSAGLIEAVLKGARPASVDRIVICGSRIDDRVAPAVRSAGLEYVVLTLPGRAGLLRRRAPSPERVAEAIDAADDRAGDVRLELDLADPAAWSVLGLEP